ncbi:MAG: hypothetical protein K0S56_869 [Microvirga sp.]|jgi:serralysin|nr:hypothetical protein [Microvirga sp.]
MLPKFIGALRKNYTSETTRWFANAQDGEAAVITFGFMSAVPEEPRINYFLEVAGSFERYGASERTSVKKSLKAWSAVANVHFVEEATQDADIMFGKHNMPYKVNGYSGRLNVTYENRILNPTDVWLDWDGFVKTRYGQVVTTHEIGHTLGLEHPLKGKGGLKTAEFASSVMSFSLGDAPYKGHPTKLGLIDIAAIQSIYGPAQRKLGADAYKVGDAALIWDGGGIDRMSAAGAKAKAHIDLNDGSWSWVGKKASSILAKDQSWLGHFTQIENAVGSKFSDTIIGNERDNVIRAGRGNDTVIGGDGADLLAGGQGNDTFVFRGFAEMGTLDRHDTISDFSAGDRIDLRGLGVTFLGSGSSDAALNAAKPGQFYFNAALGELRFESNGDGIAEFAFRVAAPAPDQILI